MRFLLRERFVFTNGYDLGEQNNSGLYNENTYVRLTTI